MRDLSLGEKISVWLGGFLLLLLLTAAGVYVYGWHINTNWRDRQLIKISQFRAERLRAALERANHLDALSKDAFLAGGDHGRISGVFLSDERVTDLSPLAGLSLEVVYIEKTRIKDLSVLAGMPLLDLQLRGADKQFLGGYVLGKSERNGVRFERNTVPLGVPLDLHPLRGMPLRALRLINVPVQDLSPLNGMALVQFNCASDSLRDISALRGMPITHFQLVGRGVKDISALRSAPLKDYFLSCSDVADVSILAGKQLQRLCLDQCPVTFLPALDVAKLTSVQLSETRITDLAPLKGAPLSSIWLQVSPVADIAVLAGMPLNVINLKATKVSDLSPLRGVKTLEYMNCAHTQVTDLSPLIGIEIRELDITGLKLRDPEQLKQLKVRVLRDGTASTTTQTVSPAQ